MYGSSNLKLSPTVVIEASAAGQATMAAGLPPTTIRKMKVFTAAGDTPLHVFVGKKQNKVSNTSIIHSFKSTGFCIILD